MATAKKKTTTKKPTGTKGYIRWTHEGMFNLEASNVKFGVPAHGIRNISIFCENVNIDEYLLRAAMRNAVKDGITECEYAGWTITWMNLDQYREWLAGFGVKTNARMRRIHGKIPASIKNFAPEHKSFAELLAKFMSK